MVPSTTGPSTVRKLEELGAEVEVFGQVPPRHPAKTGVWGGTRGGGGAELELSPLCDAGDVCGKLHPEMSPLLHHLHPALRQGCPGDPRFSPVPRGVPGVPRSDEGPICGARRLDVAPAEPLLPTPRCGMKPTGEPWSWRKPRAGSASTPSTTPWCGECCQGSAPAPRGPGWLGVPLGGPPRPVPPRLTGRVTPAWSWS